MGIRISQSKIAAALKDYKKKNLTIDEIAKKHGISARTVNSYAKQAGLTGDRQSVNGNRALPDEIITKIGEEYKRGGISAQQLASKYNVSRNTISKYLKKLGIRQANKFAPIPKSLSKKIVADYKQGMTISSIVKKYNVSRDAVTRHVSKKCKIKSSTEIQQTDPKIIQLVKAAYETTNKSISTISKLYGVSNKTISKYAYKYKWVRQQPAIKSNMDDESDFLDSPPDPNQFTKGITYESMGDKLSKVATVQFTDEECEDLLVMKNDREIDGPKSIQKIAEMFSVDLEEFDMVNVKFNTWQMMQKGGTKLNCYQTKFTLKPHVIPLPKLPMPNKVEIHVKNYKVPSSIEPKRLKRVLVVPDTQIGYHIVEYSKHWTPFHYRKGMDIVMQVAKTIRPDKIILLGDMLDMTEFTRKAWLKSHFSGTTSMSVYELSWFIKQLRQYSPEIHYLEGNHEARLPKFIEQQAAKLNMFPEYDPDLHLFANRKQSVAYNILNLAAMDVIYHKGYPKSSHVDIVPGLLEAAHGNMVRTGGGKTAAAVLSKMERYKSVIFGHTHRLEIASKTIEVEENVFHIRQACSAGCLCKTDGTVPSQVRTADWQHGFVVVDYDEETKYFNIQPISIINDMCLFEGKIYKGESYYDQLKQAYEKITGVVDYVHD